MTGTQLLTELGAVLTRSVQIVAGGCPGVDGKTVTPSQQNECAIIERDFLK